MKLDDLILWLDQNRPFSQDLVKDLTLEEVVRLLKYGNDKKRRSKPQEEE